MDWVHVNDDGGCAGMALTRALIVETYASSIKLFIMCMSVIKFLGECFVPAINFTHFDAYYSLKIILSTRHLCSHILEGLEFHLINSYA